MCTKVDIFWLFFVCLFVFLQVGGIWDRQKEKKFWLPSGWKQTSNQGKKRLFSAAG